MQIFSRHLIFSKAQSQYIETTFRIFNFLVFYSSTVHACVYSMFIVYMMLRRIYRFIINRLLTVGRIAFINIATAFVGITDSWKAVTKTEISQVGLWREKNVL